DDATISNPTSTVGTTTTYTLTITDTSNGCTDTDDVTVTVDNDLPTANAGADGTITCTTTSVQIGAASAAGFTYSWSPATGLDDATISNPTSTVGTTTTYTLTITETATGCTDTDDVTVTVDSGLPTIIAVGTDPATCGGNGSITLTLTNIPDGVYTVNYASGSFAGVLVTSGSATITTGSGTYADLSITNPTTGCTSVQDPDVTLNDPSSPDVTNVTNNSDICAMDDAIFTITGTANTNVAYSYTVGTSAPTLGTVTLDGSGNGTVTVATPQNTNNSINVVLTLVSITNPVTTCSTTLTNTSTVIVHPNPEITNITNNSDICAMDDAVFTITGTANTDVAYSYTVGTSTPVSATLTLDGSGNGTVTVATPQNTNNSINVVLTLSSITNSTTTCSTALTNTSTVIVNPNPDVTNVTNNSDICAMDDAIFTIVGTANADVAYSYTVDNNTAITGTLTLDGSGNGQVTVPTVQNTSNAIDIVLTLSNITNTATGCATTLSNMSTVVVNPNPEAVSVNMSPVCDDDLDGQMIFNLTSNINALTNNASGVTVTFYNTQADAEGLTNSFTFQGLDTSAYEIQAPASLPTTYNEETIWVNIQNDTTGCTSVTSFTIAVNTVMANGPVELFACEQDNDGFAQFNLYDAVATISGNIPSMQVYFYATPGQAAAQIPGTEIGSGTSDVVTDIYHSVVNTYEEPIYVVVVDNATGCSYNAEGIVTLTVIDAPELQTGDINYTLCDYDDDETDNVAIFDLTNVEDPANTDLFVFDDENTDITGYTFTYYSELISEGGSADVLINNATAYQNTSDPQVVYVVVNNSASGCSATKEITLLVDLPPVAESFYSLTVCDDDHWIADNVTPSVAFDLTSSEGFITIETGNEFSYYLSNADASAATNAITNTTAFENTVNPQDIYVRIENPTTGCFTVTLLELQVLPNPSPLQPSEIDAQLGVMQSCVNDGAGPGTLQEGYAIFNLLDYETDILIGEGPQVEPDVTLSYYTSESDADLAMNPITNPDNFYNTEAYGQVIWVRAENDTTGCYTLTHFDIQVPAIIITATATTDTLCVDENGVPLTDVSLPVLYATATNLTASTNESIYTYQWSLNGVEIPGATSQELIVSQAGDYVVTVTGSEQMDFTCENTATVSITASSSPDDYQASVTTNAFAENHQVIATATSSLAGVEFIYTLDLGLDTEQVNTTGVFSGVTPGPHTVTISDAGGCWEDVLDVFAIDYPHFFSPNGDGANDTWMIYGIEGIPISQIYIFDRYGKLLKQLDPDGAGWNGTYNGADMPSTDY
ncbi:T9SS type B sorting domain-containing protein, partial [Pseudofulvibacter geojedonensis]